MKKILLIFAIIISITAKAQTDAPGDTVLDEHVFIQPRWISITATDSARCIFAKLTGYDLRSIATVHYRLTTFTPNTDGNGAIFSHTCATLLEGDATITEIDSTKISVGTINDFVFGYISQLYEPALIIIDND